MDLLVRAAEERQEIVAKYEKVRNWLVGWKQKCLIMRKVNGHKYLCLCYKIHSVLYYCNYFIMYNYLHITYKLLYT